MYGKSKQARIIINRRTLYSNLPHDLHSPTVEMDEARELLGSQRGEVDRRCNDDDSRRNI